MILRGKSHNQKLKTPALGLRRAGQNYPRLVFCLLITFTVVFFPGLFFSLLSNLVPNSFFGQDFFKPATGAFSGALRAETKATLRVSGSSTLLPVTETAAEEYLKKRPDLLLTVSGTGTGEGIRSLIDGNIDIADASREVKAEEVERAKKGGVELIKYTIALDCLAVVVHPSNPINNISLKDLKAIYVGQIVNWKQLGGPDMVIVPINRDSSSGTFEMWIEEVLNGARHRPDAQVQSSSGGVAYAVSGNRYAIGYVSLGFISEGVKALSVDGVEPSHQTAQDGSYYITRDLYMYVRGDHGPEVDKFMDFMFSEAGHKIILETGFLPPKKLADDHLTPEAGPEVSSQN